MRIVKTFQQRHPRCTIAFVQTGLERSQLDWLRSGAVDLLAMRLPVSEPDVSIGPILSTEERVLVVADDHPLAAHDTVSYEDVAGYAVSDARAQPREMMDAFIPPVTPSGIMLRRVERQTVAEAFLSAAVGELVHPTVRSQVEQIHPRGVTAIPIRDLPPSQTALLWLTTNPSRRLAAFVHAAIDALPAEADNTAGVATTHSPETLHIHPSISTTTRRNATHTGSLPYHAIGGSAGARQPRASQPQDACSLCSEPAVTKRGGLHPDHERERGPGDRRLSAALTCELMTVRGIRR